MYRGPLPDYAQCKNPNRARLARLLCKNGDCSKRDESWAEMTTDHPGWGVLKKPQEKDFTAVCLRCGKTAKDPYNWHKP
jgi:hypothetical protein